ncbi:class I SAM-dependent methyltransferase [Sinomonas sp. P10A9]|uniref:Class I SAM-dependent methyltransferase n=1 Tax=Sinomonas puerhi TaxID=3238584 RepID=A0AB39L485_9MICC
MTADAIAAASLLPAGTAVLGPEPASLGLEDRMEATVTGATKPAWHRPFRPGSFFGRGGGDPYARALRRRRGILDLIDVDADPRAEPLARYDAGAWFRATPGERALLGALTGPVLDIGCGPGRFVAAARRAGIDAVGIDVEERAVRLARRGGEAVLGSVFHPCAEITATGRAGAGWGGVLLMDGNIGIGGDPAALLARVREITAPGASAWVEAATGRWTDRSFAARLRDARGHLSDEFPWAVLGPAALAAMAADTGWEPVTERSVNGRPVCLLRRR